MNFQALLEADDQDILASSYKFCSIKLNINNYKSSNYSI